MPKLMIKRIDFELAFELSDYETTAYLNSETGAVVFVEEHMTYQLDELLTGEESLDAILTTLQARTELSDIEREQLMNVAQVGTDGDNRYRMIPKQDSRDGYRDMQEYIWSLENDHLRELLEVAIQGSGAFRRFKDTLYRYPEAQENWYAFKNEREQQRMRDWFESENIEPEFI